MGKTRLMLGDMEELLMGKTKLAFPSAKTGEDNMRELSMGVTRLMLVSSTMVGDEDTVEIPIGRTLLMLISSVKFYVENIQEIPVMYKFTSIFQG